MLVLLMVCMGGVIVTWVVFCSSAVWSGWMVCMRRVYCPGCLVRCW